MKLSELHKKIFDLPLDLNKDDYRSVELYLKSLQSHFMNLAESLDEEEFLHFAKLKGTSAERRIDFLDELGKKISEFNAMCRQSLHPSTENKSYDDFVSFFFSKDWECNDPDVMIETIKAGNNFYRLRSSDSYKLMKKDEMYLIHPSGSANIGMARFNLPGYACLYLAESLYLAWEECRRPDFHKSNFVRFKNDSPLKVFCLTIPEKLNSVNAMFRAYLSLACSAKSSDKEKDHWQYRLSNLFIKMIYQNTRNNIDGIKYLSSKRFEKEDFRLKYSREYAAYVFPPKSDSEVRPCRKLAKKFSMTEPYSYFYFRMHSLHIKSSDKALTCEYDDTIFAFLENQLKNERTTPCVDIINAPKRKSRP